MSIDTIDLTAITTTGGDVSEQLAGLVRDAAALGMHVVLQPAADGGDPVRADLLVREVTDGRLRLIARPLDDLADDAVIHGAATLRPGDDCDTLRSGHAPAYDPPLRSHESHTTYYPSS